MKVIEISIIDTGKGMPPDVVAGSIESFISRNKIGSGVASPMVHGLAERSGRTLKTESIAGIGRTAPMYMPAVATVQAEIGEGVKDESFDLTGCTILIVEDEAAIRQLLTKVVASRGAHVIEAATRDSALNARSTWNDVDL